MREGGIMIVIKDNKTHATLAKLDKARGVVSEWCEKNGYIYHHSKGHGMRIYVVKIEVNEDE